jgi:hypothetical protein
MLDDKHKEAFTRIVAQYNEAERYIKQAELINDKVATAAINELRYSGRRFADLFSLVVYDIKTSECETPEAILAEIEQLCIRAKHDAIDASLTFFSQFFDHIEKTVPLSTLCTVCPNYLDIRRRQNEVDEEISKSREERAKRQAIYYKIHAEDFPILLAAFQNLRHSETVINAEFIATAKKSFSESLKSSASLIIAILSVILALVALPFIYRLVFG